MKNIHPVDVTPILGSAASSPTLEAKNSISSGATSTGIPVESVTKTVLSWAAIKVSSISNSSSLEKTLNKTVEDNRSMTNPMAPN